jgi:glycosyltransferase involved in cell wall biosynthesis
MSPITWHIITPEYPPDRGGVSDYTQHLASGLRSAGDAVHVWCPANDAVHPEWVHQIPRGMTVKSLKHLSEGLDRFPGRHRLLVQWVPHGYGYHSLNLPFCIWLWRRARSGDRVEIMLHEAFLRFFEGNWKQDAAALVHRVMTIILLQAASCVWMSSQSWESRWRPYTLGRKIPFAWLPIPTTIPVHSLKDDSMELRARLAPPEAQLIGHFGTYGKNVAPMLERIALKLLSGRTNLVLFLMGRSSETFRERLIQLNPRLSAQIVASGDLEREEVSRSLRACDLLIQPFLDGANARRTSLVAGLAHGAPIVTTIGAMTERFWETDAIVSVPVEREDLFVLETERLLGDPAERNRLRAKSRLFYEDYFDVEHAVRLLRGQLVSEDAPAAMDSSLR